MSGTMFVIDRGHDCEWWVVRGVQLPSPIVSLDGDEMEPSEARQLADALRDAADYAERLGAGVHDDPEGEA